MRAWKMTVAVALAGAALGAGAASAGAQDLSGSCTINDPNLSGTQVQVGVTRGSNSTTINYNVSPGEAAVDTEC